MSTTIVDSGLPDKVSTDPRLKMVMKVAKIMDNQFSIGGFRFGLDPILNFVPVLGDFSGYIISVVLIITMVQHGASGKVAIKMMGNATLDALVGAIPVLGWIFDFGYKANTRNINLLTQHYTQGKHTGSARPIIILILVTMLLVLAVLVWIIILFFNWIETLIGINSSS